MKNLKLIFRGRTRKADVHASAFFLKEYFFESPRNAQNAFLGSGYLALGSFASAYFAHNLKFEIPPLPVYPSPFGPEFPPHAHSLLE